MMKDYVT